MTHPRNAGRRKLRCPFGCRQRHRRQRSNERSAAYYSTPEGKRQKKLLNARRQCRPAPPPAPPDLEQPASSAPQRSTAESPASVKLRLGGVLLEESGLASSPMLPYVRMIVNLIEGVELTGEEVLGLLRRSMRQRSIARRRRIDYVLGFLHQHPP